MTIIGIDLGTTNSAVTHWSEGKSILIPNRLEKLLTPSVVGIDNSGEVIVGETAKNRLVSHPKLTTAAFKRYMGTDFKVKLGKKAYNAVELSTILLKSLKEDAEVFIGETVDQAVISVPAYFNDIQRKATIAAGELAGLQVERLINEPTAAALVYGIHERQEDSKYIILDLGGGTFDVSLVEYFDGVLEVHASSGDNHLGGEDFLKLLVNKYFDDTGIKKDKLNPVQLGRIHHALELAKLELSKKEAIAVEQICELQDQPWKIKRIEYEELLLPLINRIRLPIERTLNDAGIHPAEIDEIVLVGGATKTPAIRSLVSRMFRRLPTANIDPDLVVALGTGIQAGLKEKQSDLSDVVLTDVAPFSLGTEVINESDATGKQGGLFLPIIERNSTVPVSIERTVCTAGDNQTQLKVNVFQGESRLVKNNLFLGTFTVQVPKAPAGEEMVDIRYSYDMNGVLDVDVNVQSTGKKYHKTIVNSSNSLTEKEIEKSREKLAKLKFHPREDESNRALLARANRLYETALGDNREYINNLISKFDAVLESQNLKEIEKVAKSLEEIVDNLEQGSFFE